MTLLRILSIVLLPLFGTAAVPTIVNEPQVLSYAQKDLPHVGTLQKTPEGLVYLKVSNDYIYQLLSLLNDPSIVAPPYFGKGLVGAHITIILPNEITDTSSLPIGAQIPFEIVNLASVKTDHWEDITEIYFLTVKSKQLEKIRTKVGLPPKILDHDFHITIGVTRAAE